MRHIENMNMVSCSNDFIFLNLVFRSVFIDRFEEVLHVVYGQEEYWKVIMHVNFIV